MNIKLHKYNPLDEDCSLSTYLGMGWCGIKKIGSLVVVVIRIIVNGVSGWNAKRLRISDHIRIICILVDSRNISWGWIEIQFIQPRCCLFYTLCCILTIIFALYPSIPTIEPALSGGMVIHRTNMAVSLSRTVVLHAKKICGD